MATLNLKSNNNKFSVTANGKTIALRASDNDYSGEFEIAEGTRLVTLEFKTTTSSNVRLDNLSLSYEKMCQAPVFTPGNGSEFEHHQAVSIACGTPSATIKYTIDGSDPAISQTALAYTSEIVLTETTTLRAIAEAEGFKESKVVSAIYTKIDPNATRFRDVLNVENFDVLAVNSYDDYAYTSSKSGISYAAHLAKDENENLQLRSKNSNSGIVVTKNEKELRLKNLEIVWGKGNMADRTVDVYALGKPFATPSELYGNNNDRPKIASLPNPETSYIAENDYGFIGIRSNSATVYLKEIVLVWEEVPPTEFSISAAQYGTVYSDHAFTMPESLKGGLVTKAENTQLTIDYRYNAGDVVPAKTPILVNGPAAQYAAKGATYKKGSPAYGLLHGSSVDVLTEVTPENGGEMYYYMLSYDRQGKNLGFYWAKEKGGAFTSKAGKAYLAIEKVGGELPTAKFVFGDTTTGIGGVETEVRTQDVYSLSGVKMNVKLQDLPSGVYVVDGKKVIVK